ncbi:MAG: ArsR/SmtB family transcription factor [Candidatus Zixiibacteriota bacterium]
MRHILAITKALSDESRVRVLMALKSKELCVCQIIELLHLAPSTVSKHMAILKQAGLVEADKNGKWVYYRLACEHAPRAVTEAIHWAEKHLVSETIIKQDAENLKTILKHNPVEICKKQKASRVAQWAERTSHAKPTP